MSVNKTKLGLELPTDPRWVALAEMDLGEILTDHAYCEMKAATSGISLIQLNPDKQKLIEEVAPIVTEEWEHFNMVVSEIHKRGLTFGRQRKDEYVNKILEFQRKRGNSREDKLIERLLTCALIEARSCERFRLLSLHIADDELKEFYHGFMVSEAGHYRVFLDLAAYYSSKEIAQKGWSEYLAYEAEIMNSLEVRGDRMH